MWLALKDSVGGSSLQLLLTLDKKLGFAPIQAGEARLTMASQTDMRIPSLFNVRDAVVLVTGGATGIGEMAAQAFVQNGAQVIIASRKEAALKSTAERLNLLGPGTCEYEVADLKDRAGCDDLITKVKARTGRLTVLVNNTGASWGAPYDDFPEHGWDKVMALNVKAIFYMTSGLQPLLQRGATRGAPARVINIASVSGIQTIDVTAGEDGGVAAPGHGTFSCTQGPAVAFLFTTLETLSNC